VAAGIACASAKPREPVKGAKATAAERSDSSCKGRHPPNDPGLRSAALRSGPGLARLAGHVRSPCK
jgi:hypothetical protein